ncbi:MAG: hypothetical protein IMZ61_16320 [Planctomycetes bacterium]|nr:hypothetical protein [Planctomycetota bacterium]
MRNRKINNEQGQAMVLLVLVIVGLLGALALAVDGGMILYDRRSAQNAADAAAMAGGYERANNPWVTSSVLSPTVQAAGHSRASDNGYSAPDKVVTVDYPPTAGTFPFVPGDTNVDNYVRVEITSPVNTSFMHFVYSGPVQNKVVSVAHIVLPSRGPIFPGYGLVALAPTGCSMFYAGGNVKAILKDGGILVNSDSDKTSPACSAMTVQGGSNLIFSPLVNVVGGISNAGGLIVQPGSAIPHYSPAIPYPPTSVPGPPNCSTLATIVTTTPTDHPSYNHVMTPGSWSSSLPNEDIWLEEGIYCFTSGFDTNNNQLIGGDGVMLYITGSTPCNITWNGGATIKLSGYQSDPYKGLLMFIDPRNFILPLPAGDLVFNGNMDSYINGTIYAPTCAVKMNGTGGNFYQGQMVGYNITLLGGATINLQYVAGDNYQPATAAQVSLTQ